MDIASILRQAVDRYPDQTALVCSDAPRRPDAAGSHDAPDGSQRWTYAEWNRRASRLAHALSDLGVCPGDRVAIYLWNTEASVTSYFACQKLGAVAVPLNFRLPAGELAYILGNSGARVLVYTRDLTDAVLRAATSARGVHDFIAVKGSTVEELVGGHHDYEKLATTFPVDTEPAYTPDGGDLSALVYTSGTTGRPKGVMHTHANDVAIAMNCVMEYGLRRTDRALHIAPLYHVGGMQAFFMPHLFVGGTNLLIGRYDPARTLAVIEREAVTTLFAVPTQIAQMLDDERFAESEVSSLRLITTGGSALAGATMDRVTDELCPRLFHGYGATEASLTLLLQPEDAHAKPGSCGKPTLVTDARIVAVDGDRRVRPDERADRGQVGQLIVRGPQVMKGYWNQPIETAKRMELGWFYTGDLFTRDADGFYHYQGRADDLIVSGGENIYPREVEEVLWRMPGVRECHVLGLPDPRWGQVVTAFIVPAEPGLDADDVDAFCRRSPDLADFKRPRQVVLVDTLPRNPSGKVVKRELLARHAPARTPP
ncbi:MAG: class I adenylate-forming enzyme family protein [Egibacteraceae bacterium]